ncbi:MAG: hypothetical protein OXC68_06375 [Aestuariivita sp.]|nr:hypothetical protein [Aestuariivita sp.]
MIERKRLEAKKGKPVGEPSVEYADGITSLDHDRADAQYLLQLNRSHWSIESLPWKRDDSFKWNEDNCRIRTGHGAQNMSSLRRFAIFILSRRMTNRNISLVSKLILLMQKPQDYWHHLTSFRWRR